MCRRLGAIPSQNRLEEFTLLIWICLVRNTRTVVIQYCQSTHKVPTIDWVDLFLPVFREDSYIPFLSAAYRHQEHRLKLGFLAMFYNYTQNHQDYHNSSLFANSHHLLSGCSLDRDENDKVRDPDAVPTMSRFYLHTFRQTNKFKGPTHRHQFELDSSN